MSLPFVNAFNSIWINMIYITWPFFFIEKIYGICYFTLTEAEEKKKTLHSNEIQIKQSNREENLSCRIQGRRRTSMMMNDNNINITDDILGDEWDEDFLNSVIEAETDAISSSFKPNPTNPSSSPTSFSNHHQFQQQQQQQPPKPFVSGGFSPPRELSQRPAPTLFDTDDKDIEFERFKVILEMGFD